MKANKVPGSFFLTGNFYANPDFRRLVLNLKRDGHYLGSHSDKHLLYADWVKRDSLLVSKSEFTSDLEDSYRKLDGLGVKEDAIFFLPPYEWYNSEIAKWVGERGLKLINFSPGTLSTADYTYPEMGNSYRPSDQIYHSIMEKEDADPNGLNGFILLVHIGTDPRRIDKFYNRLDELIKELKAKQYRFVNLRVLLEH